MTSASDIIRVRKARTDEYKKLAMLRQRGLDYFLEKFRQIERGERVIFFAETDDELVGVIQLELMHDNPEMADGKTIAHLDGLFVHTDYRNKGIAKKLIAALEEEARQRGIKKITLGFKKGDSYASLWNFYMKLGYDFMKQKEDGTATIFSKTL